MSSCIEPDLSSTMPGMWVFILAVLGAIVLMVIFAFLTMRHVQKKRRESLQRRLVSGEVDLEFLGIKRLVVPPHILSALPVYVYPGAEEGDEHGASKERTENTCEETNGAKPKDTTTVTETEINDNASDNKNNNQHSNPHHPPPALTIVTSHQDESISSILEEILPPVPTRALGKRRRTVSSQTLTLTFSQHTCAICLDDFVPAESLVRELPCMHIFHPECIDTFLARDASTCPVCKQNVLPETFVEEQIGALLARREERVRRLRRRRRPRLHNRYDHEEGGLIRRLRPPPRGLVFWIGFARGWPGTTTTTKAQSIDKMMSLLDPWSQVQGSRDRRRLDLRIQAENQKRVMILGEGR